MRAWEELHLQCHDNLVGTICCLLRGRSNDTNLADEIAARVWYALVEKDGELLLRYDPECGARLITFMRAIARDIMCRHFRSERRRSIRECEASREHPGHLSAQIDQVDISLEEFLARGSRPENGSFAATTCSIRPTTAAIPQPVL